MTALLILLLAIAIDLALGDPPTALHPTGWMGQWLYLGKKCSPQRGALAQFVFGVLLIILGALLFALPAYFGLNALHAWNDIAFVIVSAMILKTTFTLRGLMRAARDTQRALDAHDLVEARRLVAWHLVSRDTRTLDEPHVVSATVESVAENIADSFVAPLLFFALFGVPGALAYRLVNTADAIIGYHGATEYLGKFAARLDDVLNWIPARVSGALVVIAAFIARANARNAWRVMLRDYARTESPNAGWTMSAMAGALDTQLEKIAHYQLGDATRATVPGMISQSLCVMFIASLSWVVLLSAYCLLLSE
ncbi:MAG: cobalamin biosynthesis protein [Chloroflexi bacterium]|nr:cobalamin biosynthesis protein [Chloroflexota bacterium]